MKVKYDFLRSFTTEPEGSAARVESNTVWLQAFFFDQAEIIGLGTRVHVLFLRDVEAPQIVTKGSKHDIFV